MQNRDYGLSTYVLPHGEGGRERLRVLARIMEEGTTRLLQRVGIARGARCLDVGCGGGDASVILAQLAGPDGHVMGVDFDLDKVEMAASEARAAGVASLAYRAGSVYELAPDESFDVVNARLLLSHLADPATALERMYGALRPGGILVVEDIEFAAHICCPPCTAMDDFIRLYTAMVASTGGDANIGPRLPEMLRRAGLGEVGVSVSQPTGLVGDVKMITPLTMQGIGARLTEAGLAGTEEVASIVADLTATAEDPGVMMSTPRIFQCWGRKPW